MDNNWMLFAREHDGYHMYYDGAEHYIDLHYGEQCTDIDPVLLTDILHGRKKIFTHNKTRYVVVARGQRYEP
jgi:allophanate hydrolase subunit 1